MTRIVVVEDDPSIAQALVDILEWEGHATVAVDGLDALSTIKAKQPDLVLLDLKMPPPDGEEVAAQLHADPATAAIPIVLVSAHRGLREAASRIGAAGTLPKPFDICDLLGVVEFAVKRREKRCG